MGPTRFFLLVTGKGEAQFAHRLFRDLEKPDELGRFAIFRVSRKVEQLHPITSPTRLQIVGRGKPLPGRDEEIALAARIQLVSKPGCFVILLDDLEHDRKANAAKVYNRYRDAFDHVLAGMKSRASVHFLVNMLEAYYFAHADAVNQVLGLNLRDHGGDVEEIPHPKNHLKRLHAGFDEIEHGSKIVPKLDLEHILEHPDRCASLRTLVAWCSDAMGRKHTAQYQLKEGKRFPVTSVQHTERP